MQHKPKDFYSRYQRHIELNGIGEEGQTKLLSARVAIIGLGGLGSPAALYLAAAGIGEIYLYDDDVVSITNLQRQILYDTSDIDAQKVVVASKRLNTINPHINIVPSAIRIDPETINSALSNVDIIIDGSDNFSTRYLLNEYSCKEKKILISGAVSFFDAQISVFKSSGPCYQCLYPLQPTPLQAPSCSESAVLGPMVGVIGSMMAVETIKEILNIGESLNGRVLFYNSMVSKWDSFEFSKNPECLNCSK